MGMLEAWVVARDSWLELQYVKFECEIQDTLHAIRYIKCLRFLDIF